MTQTEKQRAEKAQKDLAQKKEKEARLREEMETLKGHYQEYQVKRQEEIQALAQKASADDWEKFEEYARNNIYLSNKFFENGILTSEHEEIQHWLGSFLLDQVKPDSEQAFIDWAYKKHGIHLAVEKGRGELPFKIIGKQKALF